MSQRYRVLTDNHYAYFVTCTVVNWIPIFTQNCYRTIILDALAYLRLHKRTQLNAFVVMPTHLHAILWPDEEVNLSDVLRDFKRYTSRSISLKAVQKHDQKAITVFSLARQHGRTVETSKFQVWQEGFHPEIIFKPGFAQQKLEYIHCNPVRAGLVTSPEDWPFSSAAAYLFGKETYPPVDVMLV